MFSLLGRRWSLTLHNDYESMGWKCDTLGASYHVIELWYRRENRERMLHAGLLGVGFILGWQPLADWQERRDQMIARVEAALAERRRAS